MGSNTSKRQVHREWLESSRGAIAVTERRMGNGRLLYRDFCALTRVEKLANASPMLIIKAPVSATYLTFSTLAMSGLTKMLPLQVKPLPIVPTRETRAP